MKMSYKKPTKEGHYWYEAPMYAPILVHVLKYAYGKHELFFTKYEDNCDKHILVSKTKGRWSERLKEPY